MKYKPSHLKILDKGIEINGVYYSFDKLIKKKVLKLYKKYTKKGEEVGGYFFARARVENHYYIDWVSTPNRKDKFFPSKYRLDLNSERADIVEMRNDQAYVGIWHSHLKHPTNMSRDDIRNAEMLIRDTGMSNFFSLIFNHEEINFILFYKDDNKIRRISKKIKINQIWK